MYKAYCRVYQVVFKGVSGFLPWREPVLLQGENSVRKLAGLIHEKGRRKVLVVTDKGIASLGLMNGMLEEMDRSGVAYVIFDQTVPNPTIENIETALEMYKKSSCDGIVAFGGGSSMDCAKGIGARLVRPEKSIPQLKGVLKVRKRLPVLFAVPTTAGTGSEATIAAVISNPETHEKYPINDVSLIPHYAVLDPNLTIGLPKHITSTTGMDALTHAVEAYIGRSNTKETLIHSRNATKMIFRYLERAYENGGDLEAREQMLKASYFAGVAFTRAYVGYVHAVAHTLGGFYGTPHGLANAVILPYVLEYYGDAVHRSLAELADLVGLGKSGDREEQKAKAFIREVRAMNKRMGIPEKIQGIQEKDIPLMVERAHKESNPLYPVPRIFHRKDLENIYRMIKE
mgnify:CR=1 FL=1